MTSLLRYHNLVWNFAQRDLKTRYKGTTLGWLWSLVVPISTLAMYSVVFGLIFKATAPPFGSGRAPIFVVWLFVGFVAFNFFSNGITSSIGALQSVGAVLKKVYFPAYAPVLGALIAVGFQALIEVGILLVVLAALGNLSPTMLLLPVWLALFFLFVAGVSLTVSVTAIYFRDVAQLVGVVLQLLFFATPIMYPTDMIPAGMLRTLIGFNPLGKFVGLFRNLVYDLNPGPLNEWLGAVLATVVVVALGAFVVIRFGPDLGEQV